MFPKGDASLLYTNLHSFLKKLVVKPQQTRLFGSVQSGVALGDTKFYETIIFEFENIPLGDWHWGFLYSKLS